MSLLQQIPLQAGFTDQNIDIELDGNPYNIRVLWNERFGYFSLSISTADEVPILKNIKMVKNYPLIGRFKNNLLPVGDIFFVQENGTVDRPVYEDLSVNFNLYYYEPDIIAGTNIVREEVHQAILGTL